MDVLKRILEDKLFYIILGAILIVSTAMKLNEEVNPDLLNEFYEPSDSIPSHMVEEDGYLTFEEKSLRDSLVAYALTLQGKPYKYAGKGPEVFDCSGFTGYVYKNFNIPIPASSALQSRFGQEMETDDVKKGDLLIFKSPTKGVNRVGHVGLVISNTDGKIHFIHSSTNRGVVIDSLSHRHYKARYMGARSIISD